LKHIADNLEKTPQLKKILVFATLIICASVSLHAQTKPYPRDYFANPLEFPVNLSGGYGEIRPNHFHAGIDLRTQQGINKNIHAAADGFVWRVVINMKGYGKAIYIKHPNGYVTLHAHCTSFAPEIEKWVRMYQYENHQPEFDLYPDTFLFPVKKGDLIAFSGNTGSSGGPHVHFEVRDSKGEVAIHPLLFGFINEDRQKPYFASVTLYPLSKSTYINKKITDQSFPADYRDSTYTAVYEHKKKIRRRKFKITPDTIRVYGTFGVGVEVFDRLQGIRTNINKLEVFVDDKQTFGYKLDEFKFKETRNINALIDYEDRLASNEKTQLCFLQANEKLSFIRNDLGNGKITITDDKVHVIRVVATDIFGNQNSLRFIVKGEPEYSDLKQHPDKEFVQLINYSKDETFKTGDVEVFFPKDVLYDTLFFKYGKSRGGSFYSPIHRIHTPYTALADNIEIKIKTDYVEPALRSKLVMVSVGATGSIGGTYENGWMKAKAIYFGSYAVAADTKAPTISMRGAEPTFVIKKKGRRGKVKYIKTKKGKKSRRGKRGKKGGADEPVVRTPRVLSEYNFTISDNLSGIGRWDAYIDGVWVLCEFDPKTATLTYHFDENMTPQATCFSLEVTDKVGNVGKYEFDIGKIIIKVSPPGEYQ
jgi:murein DD-endopeptidase MepM/ murein hydrolase activator NlpD